MWNVSSINPICGNKQETLQMVHLDGTIHQHKWTTKCIQTHLKKKGSIKVEGNKRTFMPTQLRSTELDATQTRFYNRHKFQQMDGTLASQYLAYDCSRT